jgi:hypothetical protein
MMTLDKPKQSKAKVERRGGPRPNSGRPLAVTTKLAQALKCEKDKLFRDLPAITLTPAEFLYGRMVAPEPVRQPDEDSIVFAARYNCWSATTEDAAKTLMPYYHQKQPVALEHSGPNGGPQATTITLEFVAPKPRQLN